jgi:TatD DNase family protein
MLSDVHDHLYAVDDPDAVVRESKERGVGLIITNAEEIKTAKQCVALAHKHDIVYAAVGIHPEYALKVPESALADVERLLNEEKVVAVGEIGLDYKFARSREEKDRQMFFFSKQIALAKDYGLPVVVHSRRAHRPVVETLIDSGVTADLHWFSGPMDDVINAVEHGIYFSFGPAVLHYEAYRAVIDVVPLDLMMLETDMPVRFGGEEARPWWVRQVAEFIADVKRTSVEHVIERTWKNARRFFRV